MVRKSLATLDGLTARQVIIGVGQSDRSRLAPSRLPLSQGGKTRCAGSSAGQRLPVRGWAADPDGRELCNDGDVDCVSRASPSGGTSCREAAGADRGSVVVALSSVQSSRESAPRGSSVAELARSVQAAGQASREGASLSTLRRPRREAPNAAAGGVCSRRSSRRENARLQPDQE
jgi:hypothetical protein